MHLIKKLPCTLFVFGLLDCMFMVSLVSRFLELPDLAQSLVSA
jgi:hypothetical protein